MPPKKQNQAAAPNPNRQHTMRTRGQGFSPSGARTLESIASSHGTRRSRKQPLRKLKAEAEDDTPAANFTSSIHDTPSQDASSINIKSSINDNLSQDADFRATSSAKDASSQDAVTSTTEYSPPPTTTSRSQSPRLETESDSVPQIPESRSTTPPARHTRSHTRSTSPNAEEQQKQQPKSRVISRRPPRRAYVPKKKQNKRTRNDFEASEEEYPHDLKQDTSTQEPSAKRSRCDVTPSGHDKSTPRFMETSPVVAEDSSADDAVAEVERPPRPSRNRSRSASRQPSYPLEANTEDASAEESSSDLQQGESCLSSIKPFETNGISLTPKPTPFTSTAPMSEPLSDDLEERRKLYKELTGRDMPNTQSRRGSLKFARAYRVEDGDDDEEDLSIIAGNPSPTLNSILRNKRISGASGRSKTDLVRALLGNSEEISKAERPTKKGTNTRRSGPSTKSYKFSKVVVPANSSSIELILTGSQLIETTRELCIYAERNPTHRLPTAEEMKLFLTQLNAQGPAQPVSPATLSQSREQITKTPSEVFALQAKERPVYDLESPQNQQQRHDLDSEAHDMMMSGGLGDEAIGLQEEAGEVPSELAGPRTPTPTPQQPPAQESRGWFSSVSSLFATPVKFFSHRRQPRDATTTNGDAVISVPASEHLIPQASDFAITPTTPTNRLNRRKLIPQSERRPGILVQLPKTRPRTENRVRFKDAMKQRFEQQEQDLHLNQRRNYRADQQARLEEEDEDDSNIYVELARAGGKRKNFHPDALSKNFNYAGTFSVPESPSDEGDSHVDLETNHGYINPPQWYPADIDGGQYSSTSSTNVFSASQATLSGVANDLPATQVVDLSEGTSLLDMTSEVLVKTIDGMSDEQVRTAFAKFSEEKQRELFRKLPTATRRRVGFCAEIAGIERPPASLIEPDSTLTPGRTFSADYEESDDGDITGAGDEVGNETDPENKRGNVGGEVSVLQPKTWTQTPPPKPKPSNAQLPQVSIQPTAADLAKARYEKFKPARPSGLRNVTQMSPLHVEQGSGISRELLPAGVSAPGVDGVLEENRDPAQYGFKSDLLQNGFCIEVIEEMERFRDDEIIETRLPDYVYEDDNVTFTREVEEEVMRVWSRGY